MAIEQNEEQFSLDEEVNQQLESLNSYEAANIPLTAAYKKTEEEQEAIEKDMAKGIESLNWWETISDEMLQELLTMEWKQNFTAKTHSDNFWETFVTWPYGMVYKHIDKDWNLLKKPTAFTSGEKVSASWAEQNARAYYNKKAKQWKELLVENDVNTRKTC